MIHPDKLTIDYQDYEKPSNLTEGFLVESQGVQMHIVDARHEASAPTFVLPRSFNAYSGQGFEQWRDRVAAHALKARVVSVDTPGVGLNESAQHVPLRLGEIRQGNLEHTSTITIGAIVEALTLPQGQEVHLLGYSMGAWAAASIAASEAVREHRIRVASLHLIEPVNDQDWPLATLQKNILGEGLHAKRYLKRAKRPDSTLILYLLHQKLIFQRLDSPVARVYSTAKACSMGSLLA